MSKYGEVSWLHEQLGVGYACIVAAFNHAGELLIVFDPEDSKKRGRSPAFKLPGGQKEYGEFPPDTASRELEEETGVYISPEQLFGEAEGFNGGYVEEDKGTHVRYLFVVIVSEFKGKKDRGDEGEYVFIFSLDRLDDNSEFLPDNPEFVRDYPELLKSTTMFLKDHKRILTELDIL